MSLRSPGRGTECLDTRSPEQLSRRHRRKIERYSFPLVSCVDFSAIGEGSCQCCGSMRRRDLQVGGFRGRGPTRVADRMRQSDSLVAYAHAERDALAPCTPKTIVDAISFRRLRHRDDDGDDERQWNRAISFSPYCQFATRVYFAARLNRGRAIPPRSARLSDSSKAAVNIRTRAGRSRDATKTRGNNARGMRDKRESARSTEAHL